MAFFQAHFILQAKKMGITSTAICFYCYGFTVSKKAGFELATLPCETFFSGDEFLSAILSNQGEIILTVNKNPTVNGFISALTFGNYN
jgi:hypothetical protein